MKRIEGKSVYVDRYADGTVRITIIENIDITSNATPNPYENIEERIIPDASIVSDNVPDIPSDDDKENENCLLASVSRTRNTIYDIVHKKNKIYTVSGTYSYVAKLPAFNEEVIKRQNEKTQVIANSYGMKGFTHELEVGESSLKITSNYDFKKINFNVVDAIDTTTMPISYVTINSKVTYDDLKSELTKKKYRCVNTK